MGKSKKKEKWVKVCPKCGSRDVVPRGMISQYAYSQNWVCRNCGFQSPLFPEVKESEAKKIPRKNPKYNPSRMPFVPGKPNKIFKIVSWIVILSFILSILFVYYSII